MTAASFKFDALRETTQVVDLHQHYWPPRVVELLRARSSLPRIARADGGEELWLPGESAYPFRASMHDMGRRAHDCATAGIDYALQAPPCALGIEWLDIAESQPVFEAWAEAARAMPGRFGWWAWTSATAPDLDHVREQLDAGAFGLVLPATAMLTERRLETLAPVLELLEARDAALLVHPGVAPERLAHGAPVAAATDMPSWLPAVTDYMHQMSEATVALHRLLRPDHPTLRVVLALLGGLAPLQYGRAIRRGAPGGWASDTATFYESSSFEAGVIEAVACVVGSGQVRYGTDAPVLDMAVSHQHARGSA